VLDFYRCAMLPLSGEQVQTGHADDLAAIGADQQTPADPTAGWDAAAYTGARFDPALVGTVLPSTADVVSGAPELARLSLNIAATHHDRRVGGQRLVYGGHTIGLVLGWESCDHTGPVYEGDTLYSELHIEAADPTAAGTRLRMRSLVYAAQRPGDQAHADPDRPVLDWRFTALHF
jgi:acyl dehydratase